MGGRGSTSSMTSSRSGPSYARADTGTQAAHRNAVSRLMSPDYEDGTYDLGTMRPVEYESGYQVTFSQKGDNYSDEEYASKVNEFLAVSSDGKTLAGKFEGTPEVSFHVDNRRTAVRLARKYNQISVWDWENCDEIKTGGTGERR